MDIIKELEQLKQHHDNKQPELELTLKNQEIGLEGYIVVWDSSPGTKGPLGPCAKGGTRIEPNVTLDDVKMLAGKMALKNAAAGLPLGGAKSGFRADPNDPKTKEKYQEFAKMSKPHLHENGGAFGGFGFDIGARKEHPHWVCEALESTKSFTGKPLDMGGTDYDVEGIAGYGVAVAGRQACEALGITDKRYTVQGIGAMGAAVIRYFQDMGGNLEYISDPRIGGTWKVLTDKICPDLIKAIQTHDIETSKSILKDRHEFLSEDNNEVLYQEVDLIFPCAIQNVITHDRAPHLKAKVVVEGANSPCTYDSYERLKERDIYAVPDFLANSGGIMAAYIEMTDQSSLEDNVQYKTKTQAAKKLTEEKISKNMSDFFELMKSDNLSAHQAAYYLALSRLYK